MSEQIRNRLNKYIIHKTHILIERIYLAIIDKIYDAENYDQFEIDSDNNIYIIYSLKKDEYILTDANEFISDQIIKKYRKKLEEKLEEEGYFVEYEDSEIHVYFEEPLKTDNSSTNSETNILKFKKSNSKDIIIANIDFTNDSNIFNFGESENQDK